MKIVANGVESMLIDPGFGAPPFIGDGGLHDACTHEHRPAASGNAFP